MQPVIVFDGNQMLSNLGNTQSLPTPVAIGLAVGCLIALAIIIYGAVSGG